MKNSSLSVAVFLGRFQPFHIGHMSIVEKIFSQDFDKLLLVIGSAEKSGTDENPWNLQEREEIIRASIPLELQERIDIIGLTDVPDDDEWCENLQKLILAVIASPTLGGRGDPWIASQSSQGQGMALLTLFTGNEWVRDICERHNIPTDWIDSYQVDISGTKIREMMRNKEDVSDYVLAEFGTL